jgi:hypothetical protein
MIDADIDPTLSWGDPSSTAEMREGVLERTKPLTLTAIMESADFNAYEAPSTTPSGLTSETGAQSALAYEAAALVSTSLSSATSTEGFSGRRATEDFRVEAQNGDEVQLAWDSPNKGIFA